MRYLAFLLRLAGRQEGGGMLHGQPGRQAAPPPALEAGRAMAERGGAHWPAFKAIEQQAKGTRRAASEGAGGDCEGRTECIIIFLSLALAMRMEGAAGSDLERNTLVQ